MTIVVTAVSRCAIHTLKLVTSRGRLAVAGCAIIACWASCARPAFTQEAQIRLVRGSDVVVVRAYAPNVVGIHVEPRGNLTPRTLVIDPSLRPEHIESARLARNGDVQTLILPEMRVVASESPTLSIQVRDARGQDLLTIERDSKAFFGPPAHGPPTIPTVMIHDENEPLYGIEGLPWHADIDPGILRNDGGAVAAGMQGDGGAPFFLTKRYGVLVDSDGGSFMTIDDAIRFRGGSRPDTEYFVIVGAPLKVMAGLATLTGRPPLPPKWTLGFLNSQWGSSEQEWKQITRKYEQEDIPVSAYILDFDWKAWGEDDYGEWRWNSTSGPGNVSPDKFPDGASGKFAAQMLAHGIHLVGIVKPRVIMYRPDGKLTQAAADATEHHFWYPHESPGIDYFSHRLAADIDFGNAAARQWFWEHLAPASRAGISGWWNDEADENGGTVFDNFQFMNMGRMEYEGQRSISNDRVWSLNRNYYLGAGRYAYAEWSGDITTGFQSMAYQRRRMIAALNLGEPQWSMDIGGFIGHPTPQNYARWMEFGAFVPIFRVHGAYGEKRQPWVYGPIAEAAAKKVIRLRYDLMPYLYSYARVQHETGIGVVRPLFWVFPDAEPCSTETNAWMFGDALLVSPIVEQGLPTHRFYLPAGVWYEYASGKPIQGGRVITTVPDQTTWQDIPLYVRAGSIVATQPQRRGNELSPGTPLLLDVFPSSARAARFLIYDDDGVTYDYERGVYFRQELTATRVRRVTNLELAAATGTYRPHFSTYIFRVHQASSAVIGDGRKLTRFASERGFEASRVPGWHSTVDRFGAVTEVRLAVDGSRHTLSLLLH